jgi:hypothetical protein
MDGYHCHNQQVSSMQRESQLLLLKLRSITPYTRVTSYTREIEVNLNPNDHHKVYQVYSIWRKSQIIFSKLPTIRSKGFKKRPVFFDDLPVVEEVSDEDSKDLTEFHQDIVRCSFSEEQQTQVSYVYFHVTNIFTTQIHPTTKAHRQCFMLIFI